MSASPKVFVFAWTHTYRD